MQQLYLLRRLSNLLSKKCSLFFPNLIASKRVIRCLSSSFKPPAESESQRFPTNELHLNTYENDQNFNTAIDYVKYAKEHGHLVPDFISTEQLRELSECETRSQMKKYLTFLFKKERKKLADIRKKEKRRLERENKIIAEETDDKYGLRKNTMLLLLQKHTYSRIYDLRLADAILFGQKLVIDLDYDRYMTSKEQRNCASQLRLVHTFNRCSREPYHLHFCNARGSDRCVKYLQQEMPNLDRCLLSMTEENYLDIFPRDRLVYLSPHAETPMETYDHQTVYIIGGFVDTVKREHLSLHKARAEGIRTYSLPIDKYVLWGTGSRSLSINQVFQIMMEMKRWGEWGRAFAHIPTRKLRRIAANDDSAQGQKLFLYANKS